MRFFFTYVYVRVPNEQVDKQVYVFWATYNATLLRDKLREFVVARITSLFVEIEKQFCTFYSYMLSLSIISEISICDTNRFYPMIENMHMHAHTHTHHLSEFHIFSWSKKLGCVMGRQFVTFVFFYRKKNFPEIFRILDQMLIIICQKCDTYLTFGCLYSKWTTFRFCKAQCAHFVMSMRDRRCKIRRRRTWRHQIWRHQAWPYLLFFC